MYSIYSEVSIHWQHLKVTYDFVLHNKYGKDAFLELFLPEVNETNQPEDSKSNNKITSS